MIPSQLVRYQYVVTGVILSMEFKKHISNLQKSHVLFWLKKHENKCCMTETEILSYTPDFKQAMEIFMKKSSKRIISFVKKVCEIALKVRLQEGSK
jgi:CMP-N-acetylneuraminic acid synthetase